MTMAAMSEPWVGVADFYEEQRIEAHDESSVSGTI